LEAKGKYLERFEFAEKFPEEYNAILGSEDEARMKTKYEKKT